MKKGNALSRLCNVLGTVLVVLVLALVLPLVAPKLMGIQMFGVLSGSMEPTFHVGSLVYVKPTDPAQIAVGDPIAFRLNAGSDTLATHRVVAKDEQAKTFTTKGDANKAQDSAPVAYRQVIGKVVLSVPQMGYVASFVQSKPGVAAIVAALVLAIACWILADVCKKRTVKKQ